MYDTLFSGIYWRHIMRKVYNKWDRVEVSVPKKDKIVKYKTNFCLKCGKESLVQTNYCPHCGKRQKKGC